jgi:hypothetical protein
VAERLGISTRTLKRWQLDPRLNFPAPTVTIRNGDYWDTPGPIDEWDARQKAAPRVVTAPVCTPAEPHTQN